MKTIKPLQAYTDNELLIAYKQTEDKLHFGELFKRYSGFVFAVSMKYLKNPEEAKELTQNLFEKLLTDINRHNIVSFKTWVYTVTKNECLMKLRSSKSKRNQHENFEKDTASFMEKQEELHLIDEDNNEIKLKQLEQGIETLDSEQKTCITMFYLEEKSYKEVAENTGFDLNQVKSYIQNGKRNLKNFLLRNHAG